MSARVRRLTGALVLLGAAGCAGARTPDGGSAAGVWEGTDGNLVVHLTLVAAGDSLAGEGTYTLRDPAQLGCGGETLPRSGRVALAGVRASGQYGGRFRFIDGDWSPPYSASWSSPDTLRGGFMSVDRGRCPLILVRQR